MKIKTSGRRGGKTEEQRRQIACVLNGHPRIVRMCFGYVTCARCGHQVGDTLAGSYDVSADVIVGHDCAACQQNAAKLTRRELTLLPPDVRDEVKALLAMGAK
jgi:hypothetical protein